MVTFLGAYTAGMKLADLHIHTSSSDGLMTPQEAVDLAVSQGLSAIAITDHGIIKSAQEAQKYSRDQGYPLEVVVGSEITTKQGHLIGLYLKEKVPGGKSLDWTIAEIHRQGGLTIAPHPFYVLLRNLGHRNLMKVISSTNPDIYFDGFEVWNGAIYNYRITNANTKAKYFYLKNTQKLGAALAGTDAHFHNLGQGLTGYKGNLRQAITAQQTIVLYQPQREKVPIKQRLQQLCYGFLGQVVHPVT